MVLNKNQDILIVRPVKVYKIYQYMSYLYLNTKDFIL